MSSPLTSPALKLLRGATSDLDRTSSGPGHDAPLVYAPRALKAAIFLSSASLLALAVTGCDGCSKPQVSPTDAAPADSAAPTATTVTLPDAGPMNVTPIPMATIAKMVNPQKLPAYTGPTGSIEGTITVTGDPSPATPADFSRCPDGEKVYGRAFRDGPLGGDGSGRRWLADAVVAVTGYGNFYIPEKNEAVAITIEGCGYSQRTVTMTFGQRLEVKNLTKQFWTPKLEPPQSGMLMMATPGGDAVKLYPKQPGHYHLIDHDRKYVVDDLYAFLHPLHTASKVGGSYRIDGVPVGKVKVNTSHPRIPDTEASQEIEIRECVVAKVDLELVNKTPAPAPTDADAAYPKLR